eukprot:CAMPEP_0194256014 /NCGR_PEP_ID=MMETSP0158-20130606/35808_1 /TAXON_ID=33649 /ORGANISM="Thalassionema nitzschioides, Strain L26-B" /LENGTH=569 /DNA_ID=CAMNT_0038994559 /DNA_START=394 /DNA_END=2103 /DNA_ORIENTATION=-
MIPGFVTSGLELWQGHECAKKYFRQRLWGALGTARSFFTETECWRQHLALDPTSGMDPPNIRVRAAQGFEAADYFMTGYWVWDKMIKNLAAVGYDGSNMSLEPYDWRLAFPLLEERDGYFTKLMHKIEAMHKTTGKKIVIVAHSMGTPLVTYFFAWVTSSEQNGGGGRGHDWVDKHVHALTNIAGPMLGVPKSITSIMSGEMKDTNVLMGTFGSMLEQFFGRRHRKDLWSSWGSLWAMLPKGGNKIWGNGVDICNDATQCVNNSEINDSTTTPFLSFTDNLSDASVSNAGWKLKTGDSKQTDLENVISDYSKKSQWTVEETLTFLLKWGTGIGQAHAGTKYHALGRLNKRDWSDPTITPLPKAPNMKIYCLYGVGLETERAFFYKKNVEDHCANNNKPECTTSLVDLPFIMDGSVEDNEKNIRYGVRLADGDGSVPLISLGYMCVDGWKQGHLNPSGVKIITREYPHHHEFLVDDPMRGGPKSAEHVDIMGNIDLSHDVIRIVTNFEIIKVETKITSNIEAIASRIRNHPNGRSGVKKLLLLEKKKQFFSVLKSIFRKLRRGGKSMREV